MHKFSYGWLLFGGNGIKHHFYIQNNILFSNYNDNKIIGSPISDLFYDDNLIVGPLFVDPGRDFHLRSGSPAINRGFDVGLTRYFDDTPVIWLPDIGAFEYVLKLEKTRPLIE